MRSIATLLVVLFTATGCMSSKSAETAKAESADETSQTANAPAAAATDSDYVEPKHGNAVPPKRTTDEGYERALFAGGCFWCMEPPFDEVDGVIATVSGYAGGPEADPKYKQVAYGRTGHTESVLVVYDPAKVSYEELLDVFWRSHDPTDPDGQFVDQGSQYRPAIFAYDAEQKKLATKSKKELEKSGPFDEPIATKINDAAQFWPAEDYHQDFYKKDAAHYKRYRSGSGRDQFLQKHW